MSARHEQLYPDLSLSSHSHLDSVGNLQKYSGKIVRALTLKASAVTNVLQTQVQVCEAFNPHTNPPPGTILQYVAIWDTGATNTVITSKVVNELGLKPSGKITVQGVGASGTPAQHVCDTYLVNILLPNQVGFFGVRVSENSISGCDVLIGMDLITRGDFAITNHNSRTTFTFRVPPCDEIDFVQEVDEYNRLNAPGVQQPNPDQKRQLRNKRKATRRKTR